MSKYQTETPKENKNIENDVSKERLMDRFLIDNVYPEFIKLGLISSITSIEDVTLQKNGVDAIWVNDEGEKVYFDNKTRWSMMDKVSRAVPFELRTNNKDGTNRHDGWFTMLSKELKEEKTHLTDYIFFVHPYSKDKENVTYTNVTYDDIKSLDIHIVRVDEVFNYLNDYFGLKFTDIYDTALKFDNEFFENTEGLTDEEIPHSLRKCIKGFEKGTRERISSKGETYTTNDVEYHTSAKAGMNEDPLNLLIREDICKILPHTRHFYFEVDKGLKEFFDVKERREFSKIKEI